MNIFLCGKREKLLCYQTMIYEICQKKGIRVKVHLYEQKEKLLRETEIKKKTMDLVLIREDLQEMTGISMIKEMRCRGCEDTVFLLADQKEEGFRKALEIEAFFYLETKVVDQVAFETVLWQALEKQKERNEKLVVLGSSNEKMLLKIRDIFYLQVEKKRIMVYGTQLLFSFSGRMKEMEEIFAERGFARIHRKFMINLEMVRKCTSQYVVLYSGKKLPVGRVYHKDLKERLSK